LPLVSPSADVTVRPISESACASAEVCSICSSLVLIWMDCSTWLKAASWATYCVESIGLVGSWFFICATRSFRNDW
jgi:hypothetical protein